MRLIANHLGKALAHLHEQNRIHGDLKPLNACRYEGRWVLIDLDCACAIDECFGDKTPSTAYCPPEVARLLAAGQPLSDYTASEAYDLWSFGALLVLLCTAKPPQPKPF